MHDLHITTAEMRLRHFVLEDADRIRALNAEPTTRQWLPSHVYETRADAVEAMNYLIGCYTSPGNPRLGPYVLALEDASTRLLLGHVGFSPWQSEVEVSYAIAESARGRGYATQALASACDWVSRTFEIHEVVALTAAANDASRRLLARAGFVHVRDERHRFQGSEELVSHYRSRAPSSASGGA